MVNSGFLDGMSVKAAIPAMTKWLEEKGLGRAKVNYKLRDWVFSRQRYWGEPIPIIHCPKCGWVPMDEKDLPLLLPDVESYEPTDNGESPLAHMRDWVECTCPKCGGPGRARDGHHAQLGRLLLVFPALHGSAQRRGPREQGGPRLLEPRRLVQRRHGAHDAPPAVQPLLAQVPLRHRRRADQGALRQAHQPRHDTRPQPAQPGTTSPTRTGKSSSPSSAARTRPRRPSSTSTARWPTTR